MRKINILFIASGRRVSLVEAFKNHGGFRTIGVDSNNSVPTSHVVDDFFVVSPWRDKVRFVADIIGIVFKYEVDIIVPLMDDACHLLAEVDNFIWGDAILLGAFGEGLQNVDMKSACSRFFRLLGLKTPEIAKFDYDGLAMCKTVARLEKSTGGRGMKILEKGERGLKNNDYFYTNFVCGSEYTVDCFKSIEGTTLCTIPRQRLEVRGGEVQKAMTVPHDEIMNQAKIISDNLDYVGPMCCQCILTKDNEVYWLEINPRFGGGVPLSIYVGADMPSWTADICNKQESEPMTESLRFVEMSRADREFYSEQ